MNLYFLVEGERTEMLVYRAWVGHMFPALRQVESAGELAGGSFYLLAGQGYPAYKDMIETAALEIRDNPNVDHFFVCVDSEEWTFERRHAEVLARVEEAFEECGVREGNPNVKAHIIVQHRCVETWFLGNADLFAAPPRTQRLLDYLSFHDVRVSCPEAMGRLEASEFRTIPKFHAGYLREALQNMTPPQRYMKGRPGPVAERTYFEALRARVSDTGHLPSLECLLRIWQEIGAAG